VPRKLSTEGADSRGCQAFSCPRYRGRPSSLGCTAERHDHIPNRGVGHDHLRRDAPALGLDTKARTLEQALSWFAELGLAPPNAVMTDNAFVYTRWRG
jgi:hypothetical protein